MKTTNDLKTVVRGCYLVRGNFVPADLVATR